MVQVMDTTSDEIGSGMSILKRALESPRAFPIPLGQRADLCDVAPESWVAFNRWKRNQLLLVAPVSASVSADYIAGNDPGDENDYRERRVDALKRRQGGAGRPHIDVGILILGALIYGLIAGSGT